MVKEFLDAHGADYSLRRVTHDPAAARAFQAKGWRLPPVVEAADRRAVEGYDPAALTALLAPGPGR